MLISNNSTEIYEKLKNIQITPFPPYKSKKRHKHTPPEKGLHNHTNKTYNKYKNTAKKKAIKISIYLNKKLPYPP